MWIDGRKSAVVVGAAIDRGIKFDAVWATAKIFPRKSRANEYQIKGPLVIQSTRINRIDSFFRLLRCELSLR